LLIPVNEIRADPIISYYIRKNTKSPDPSRELLPPSLDHRADGDSGFHKILGYCTVLYCTVRVLSFRIISSFPAHTSVDGCLAGYIYPGASRIVWVFNFNSHSRQPQQSGTYRVLVLYGTQFIVQHSSLDPRVRVEAAGTELYRRVPVLFQYTASQRYPPSTCTIRVYIAQFERLGLYKSKPMNEPC